MYFLYILQSCVDQTYYIGITFNIKNRMIEHNYKSSGKYTNKKRPWKLIFSRSYNSKTDALIEEKRLKRCKNSNYLESYIIKNINRAIPIQSG
jgi:putative endonuclease